jgi:hypothetical protein
MLTMLAWHAAAAPLELTGAYTASTEFVSAASRETSTRPGAMLELRLTIQQADGALTGFLDAQVQRSLLRFAFPITGSLRSGRVDLAVQANLCLERPTVHLIGVVTDDGAITFAATSQTITCNSSSVYLELPKSLHLLRTLAP